MTEITLEAVRAALKDVVSEFGEDHVYVERDKYPSHIDPDGPAGGSCFYVHDSDKGSVPGCLVAQVLHKHFDWSIDQLKDIEGRSAIDIPGLPKDVADYLYRAQEEQDGGASWGYALIYAEGVLSKGE